MTRGRTGTYALPGHEQSDPVIMSIDAADLDQYFERIGYPGPGTATFEALRGVHEAHVLAVPFENIDVQLGVPLTTDADCAWEKIVRRRRGGWCYEQNGVLGLALSMMGFGVTRVAAAVMREERGSIAIANHLCLLIRSPDTPDNSFLADVGFGGSLLQPVAFRQDVHEQPPFALTLRPVGDGYWRFEERSGVGVFSYDFRPEAGSEDAMAERCRFLQTDPVSSFVQTLIVQRRTPHSRMTLRNRELTIVTREGAAFREIEDREIFENLLVGELGVDSGAAAPLWERVRDR